MNVFVRRGACPGVGVRGRCTVPTTRNTAIHRGIRHQFHDDKSPPGQRLKTPQNHHGTTPPNLRRQTTTEPMTPTLHHGTPPPNSRRHHQPNPRNEEPHYPTAQRQTRTAIPQSTTALGRQSHDDNHHQRGGNGDTTIHHGTPPPNARRHTTTEPAFRVAGCSEALGRIRGYVLR
jgi:hypothetical protein